MILLRLTLSSAIAGVELAGGRVVRAAPVIRYMLGWSVRRVQDYCQRRGWRWQLVSESL